MPFDEQKFMQDRGLVSEQEVSEYFGVCRRTLARKRKNGLPHYIFKRRIYYRMEDVLAWANKEIKEISGDTNADSKRDN